MKPKTMKRKEEIYDKIEMFRTKLLLLTFTRTKESNFEIRQRWKQTYIINENYMKRQYSEKLKFSVFFPKYRLYSYISCSCWINQVNAPLIPSNPLHKLCGSLIWTGVNINGILNGSNEQIFRLCHFLLSFCRLVIC